jgi:hypothetical protein
MSRVLAFAFIAAFVGCRHKAPYVEPPPRWHWADVGKVCTPNSPAYPLPDLLRDTSAHPFRSADSNDWEDKAKLTQDIPGGFGGIGHRDVHPRTIVYLLDTAKLVAAIPALVSRGLLPPNPVVAAAQGRFSYPQLYDWFRYITMHIRGVGVAGWTLDDRRNRIFYMLEDEAAAVNLEHRLAEMNAPCFLVAVEVTGRFHAANGTRH